MQMADISSPALGQKRSRSAVLKSIVLPNSRPLSPVKRSPEKSRPQSSLEPFKPKDKENTTPPGTAETAASAPIWAQFATPALHDPFQSPKRAAETSAKDFAQQSKAAGVPGTTACAVKSPSDRNTETRSSNKSAASSHTSTTSSVSLTPRTNAEHLSPSERQQLEIAFEDVLAAQNIPENMRHNMRCLDLNIKADFIRHANSKNASKNSVEPAKSSFWDTISRRRSKSATKRENPDHENDSASPSKRSRSRGRTGTRSRDDGSPSKRSRSNSRSRPFMLLKNLSSSSINSIGQDNSAESSKTGDGPRETAEISDNFRRPDDFIKYLRDTKKAQDVEVGKLHKLRLLLRNETVSWVDTFILKGGMSDLLALLRRLREIEWREEHDDLVLHETLLCLKGLCTTERALNQLHEESPVLFPDLLNMLFDEERRGPSEFNTRVVVISLLYSYLASVAPGQLRERAETILTYLSDPTPPEESKPVSFIVEMQQRRPYQKWCTEVSNVTKEVFWIFLHHHNVISVDPVAAVYDSEAYSKRHFPKARPPVPAASWVGGVEWEASNYLATHLDLMNGLIASMPSKQARNTLRTDLKASGFEKTMGATLRTCKEKFYMSIHDALRTWIAAAVEDEWPTGDVKMGPPPKEQSPTKNASKSPKKDAEKAKPPQLELPRFDIGQGDAADKLPGNWI